MSHNEVLVYVCVSQDIAVHTKLSMFVLCKMSSMSSIAWNIDLVLLNTLQGHRNCTIGRLDYHVKTLYTTYVIHFFSLFF